jgi:hypothetical protein
MGIVQYKADIMTSQEAKESLKSNHYFDYIKGRPIKTDFKKFPLLNSNGYDRDNGNGSFQKCVNNIKNKTFTNAIPREMPTQKEIDETLIKLNNQIDVLPFFSGGKTIESVHLQKYDKVWFTKQFLEDLSSKGISNSSDWFIYAYTDNICAIFIGSKGGVLFVNIYEPVIEYVEQFNI